MEAQPKSKDAKRTPAPKPAPTQKHFNVLVRRTAVLEAVIPVEAQTKGDAKEKAVAVARNEPLDSSKSVLKVQVVGVDSGTSK